MKHNLDWYRHDNDSDEHPKFKALRASFGWEGEGRFWALNNRISRAEGCLLDLSRRFQRAVIAQDLDMAVANFEAFLEFLCDPEQCGLVDKIGSSYTTDRLQEGLRSAEQERLIARWRAENSKRRRLRQEPIGWEGWLISSGLPISPENARISPEKQTFSPDAESRLLAEKKTSRLEQSSSTGETISPEKEAAAANLSPLAISIREELEASLYCYQDAEIAAMAERFERVDLDAGFVKYAIDRAKLKNKIDDMPAFLLTALMTYDDWAAGYKAKRAREIAKADATNGTRAETAALLAGKGAPLDPDVQLRVDRLKAGLNTS